MRGSDKTFWHKELVDAGVSTIPILATVEGSNVQMLIGPDSTSWNDDLFAKPDDGMRGIGAMKFRYSSPDSYKTKAGTNVSLREIFDLLAKSRIRYVVQPSIRNHHRIAKLVGGDVLTSARIYTMLGPQGVPKLIPIAFFKLPNSEADADNVRQGAHVCGLDPSTGGLLSVYCRDLTRVSVNPFNDTSIEDFRLPFWEESLELALRAHSQVSNGFMVVGWDVAATERGPVIVEGNMAPGSFEYLDGDTMHGEVSEISEVFDYLAHEL